MKKSGKVRWCEVDRIQWEMMVINHLETELDCTTSDAQGIMEAAEIIWNLDLDAEHAAGMAPLQVAKKINEKSKQAI